MPRYVRGTPISKLLEVWDRKGILLIMPRVLLIGASGFIAREYILFPIYLVNCLTRIKSIS